MNSKSQLLPSLAVIATLLLLLLSAVIDAASILECPPHSTFNGCMSRCPKTCANIDLPPTNCISACSVGCECLEGFVKVAKGATAQCVKAYECPMYTKQSTLPYPVLRKLAAAASVPANQAGAAQALLSQLTTLTMAGTGSGAGAGGSSAGRMTTAAMATAGHGGSRTTSSAAAAAVSSTIAVLRKVKQARPEENESHED